MRKLMLLAAMLAMVLVAAAPALAQATVNSDDDVDNSQTQYQNIDCDQVQAAAANQYNAGDANAAADDGEATAEIAQDLGISQDAVLNCLGVQAGDDADVDANQGGDDAGDVVVLDDAEDGELLVVINGFEIVDLDGDGLVTVSDVILFEEDCGCDVDGDGAVASASAAASASASASSSSSSSSSSESGAAVLPDTGGASLFTLGAGALLVGGGLLARRIFS